MQLKVNCFKVLNYVLPFLTIVKTDKTMSKCVNKEKIILRTGINQWGS